MVYQYSVGNTVPYE